MELGAERFVIFYYKTKKEDGHELVVHDYERKPVIIIGVRDLLIQVNTNALSRLDTKFTVYRLGECIADFS